MPTRSSLNVAARACDLQGFFAPAAFQAPDNFANVIGVGIDAHSKHLRDVTCTTALRQFSKDRQLHRRQRTSPLASPKPIVMSQWYRDALGGIGTRERIELWLTPPKEPWLKMKEVWYGFRAACHHPDIVARLGTRLGVLGAWLGFVGLVGLIPPVFATLPWCSDIPLRGGTLAVIIAGIVGWFACRGVNMTPLP